MKLLPKSEVNNKDAAAAKDMEKCKQFDDVDIKMDKKRNNLESTIIGLPDNMDNNQNQRNRNLRNLLTYERRMDRGLFCALALIIVLCLLGMGTSIGGALYLKFRSSNNNTQTVIRHSLPGIAGLKQRTVDITTSSSLTSTMATTSTTESDDDTATDEDKPTKFHIRLNISFPIIEDELPLGFGRKPEVDPFESSLWNEMKRREGFFSTFPFYPRDTPKKRVGKVMSGDSLDSTTDSTIDSDKEPSFAVVNKHRVLQQPPSFAEVLTALRKALRIPAIKIVRDHDQI
jgi:hypothetical protein